MHWFTSDTHVGHRQILEYDKRPFSTITEHDKVIAERCRPSSEFKYNELWMLGDVAFKIQDLKLLLERIRPHWNKIHLIRGNHDDKVAWRHRDLFDSANEALYIRVDTDTKVYVSHYAHRVWRNSHHGAYHVHGHSHGQLPEYGRSIDAHVGDHDWSPISMDRIKELRGNAAPINHHATRSNGQ